MFIFAIFYCFLLLFSPIIYLPFIFSKINLPFYQGFIPFWNIWCLLKKMQKPWYWFLPFLTPFLNLWMHLILQHDLAHNLGYHKSREILAAIFLPFLFFPIISKQNLTFSTTTDWENEKYRQNRKWADAWVLSFLSFGLGWILFALEQFKILKRKINKPSIVKEWKMDLGYAMIAATFLRLYFFELFMIPTGSMEKNLRSGDFLISSRFVYGIQLPRTPLSFPAFHNTVPFLNLPSYLDWINLPYQRFGNLNIDRNDPVVFYFPAGDTAVMDPNNYQGHNYQQLLSSFAVEIAEHQKEKNFLQKRNQYLELAKKFFIENYGIIYRPVDKRENYVKRCVGLPGDSLEIIQGKIYINGQLSVPIAPLQFRYWVTTKNPIDTEKFKEKWDVYLKDIQLIERKTEGYLYDIVFLEEQIEALKKSKEIVSVESQILPDKSNQDLTFFAFPNHPDLDWNIDNMGPIYLPKKGDTILLNPHNVLLYRRAIENYEGHQLTEKEGSYLIDEKPAVYYVFQMNYYWMMGDNRHNSADSRNWGYVPEDHIGGKPLWVLFSKDLEKNWLIGWRFDRLFKKAK